MAQTICLSGSQFVRPKFKFLTYQPPLVSMINKYIIWEVQAMNEKKDGRLFKTHSVQANLKHTLALNYESRQDKHVFSYFFTF